MERLSELFPHTRQACLPVLGCAPDFGKIDWQDLEFLLYIPLLFRF
jgi:hypothetical protein